MSRRVLWLRHSAKYDWTIILNEATPLEQLREAAVKRDPEQSQFLLKKLFMEMDFYLALAVVVERAQSFLETFEHYYPDARFARQILMQMVNTGTAPSRLPPEALRDFEAPGAANYMKALSDLAHALQQGPLPPRIGYLVSATVNAIMAELVEHYYGQHLDRWALVRENPAGAGGARNRVRLLDGWGDRPAGYRSLAASGGKYRNASAATIALKIDALVIITEIQDAEYECGHLWWRRATGWTI